MRLYRQVAEADESSDAKIGLFDRVGRRRVLPINEPVKDSGSRPVTEKAGGRYAVGFLLRLPGRHCSGSAAFRGNPAAI